MRSTASIAKILPLAVLATLTPAIAPAASAETVNTDTIFACTELTDDAARLACFDAAVSKFKAAEDAGEVQTFTKEDVTRERKRNFGFAVPSFNFGKDPSEKDEIQKLEVNVISAEYNAYKKLTLTLDNGQVWQQTDGKRVSTRNVKTAEIKKASLGSYKIKLDGGPAFKAKRIK